MSLCVPEVQFRRLAWGLGGRDSALRISRICLLTESTCFELSQQAAWWVGGEVLGVNEQMRKLRSGMIQRARGPGEACREPQTPPPTPREDMIREVQGGGDG